METKEHHKKAALFWPAVGVSAVKQTASGGREERTAVSPVNTPALQLLQLQWLWLFCVFLLCCQWIDAFKLQMTVICNYMDLEVDRLKRIFSIQYYIVTTWHFRFAIHFWGQYNNIEKGDYVTFERQNNTQKTLNTSLVSSAHSGILLLQPCLHSLTQSGLTKG